MRIILRLIRKLFLRDEGLNLIHSLMIYPGRMKGNQLDPRMDYNKPFMIICFDYIQDPETDEQIIRSVEKIFKDVPEFEGEKLPTVRKVLTASTHESTTSFKERISLS